MAKLAGSKQNWLEGTPRYEHGTLTSTHSHAVRAMSVLRIDEASLEKAIRLVENTSRAYVYREIEVPGEALRAILKRLRAAETWDWKEATLFFVPSWKAIPAVIRHPAFGNVASTRKHFLFHAGNDPAKCVARQVLVRMGYKDADLAHLLTRIQRMHFIEFGGRRDCGGVCHSTVACCHGCYSGFDGAGPLVVPPEIPKSMYRAYDPRRRRRALFAMDMDYELATRNFQVERVQVTRYFEMARLNRTRQFYDSHLASLISRKAGQYETLMGVHAAGFGIWSARFFAYVVAGTIPVLFTDGVVMPFERVLRYERFVVKIALQRAISLDYTLLDTLETMERLRMDLAHSPDWFDATIEATRTVAPWVDWSSRDTFRNPSTLVLLEMWCRGVGNLRIPLSASHEICSWPSSRLAFQEVWPQATRRQVS